MSNLKSRAVEAAKKFLICNDHEILETGWSCFAGAIDIIARDGDTLVFADVNQGLSRRVLLNVQARAPGEDRARLPRRSRPWRGALPLRLHRPSDPRRKPRRHSPSRKRHWGRRLRPPKRLRPLSLRGLGHDARGRAFFMSINAQRRRRRDDRQGRCAPARAR